MKRTALANHASVRESRPGSHAAVRVKCSRTPSGAVVRGSVGYRAAPKLESRGRHRYALCREGAARHLSMSKSTVPLRGNLFEWLKNLKAVIERQHLDRGEPAEPG
jgi:hypothetical protein